MLPDFSKVVTDLTHIADAISLECPQEAERLLKLRDDLSRLRYIIVDGDLDTYILDSLESAAEFLGKTAAAPDYKFSSKRRIFFGEQLFLSKSYPQYLLQAGCPPAAIGAPPSQDPERDDEGFLLPIDAD